MNHEQVNVLRQCLKLSKIYDHYFFSSLFYSSMYNTDRRQVILSMSKVTLIVQIQAVLEETLTLEISIGWTFLLLIFLL